MYADDTTVTLSAQDPCVLEQKMNYDVNLIQSWLSANKLTLSRFKLSQKVINNFTVKVNNIPLIKHKSLGVQIDESLNLYGHTLLLFGPSKKIFTGLAYHLILE